GAMSSRGRYFFFQAEDGIRDYKVTGVQTCALPICTRLRFSFAKGIQEPSFEESFGSSGVNPTLPNANLKPEENRSLEGGVIQSRSEERRVGKEWRSWRAATG